MEPGHIERYHSSQNLLAEGEAVVDFHLGLPSSTSGPLDWRLGIATRLCRQGCCMRNFPPAEVDEAAAEVGRLIPHHT